MKAMSLLDVDPLLSDRVRLAIMVTVAGSSEAVDFNTLLRGLELTKGNLSTHLRRLEDGGLLEVEKAFVERKPRTSYRCTKKGSAALNGYLQVINQALKGALE